jgi:hypothetical protein
MWRKRRREQRHENDEKDGECTEDKSRVTEKSAAKLRADARLQNIASPDYSLNRHRATP